MERVYSFEALIKSVPDVNGAYVEFPYDALEEFGTQGRVKVIAELDGVEYRGSLVKMKTPCHIIGITKAIREQIGKQPGDMVSVSIKIDKENKVNEMPENLVSALSVNKTAELSFSALTPSQKNKFIDFLTSAKKSETVAARLEKIILMLERGEKMK